METDATILQKIRAIFMEADTATKVTPDKAEPKATPLPPIFAEIAQKPIFDPQTGVLIDKSLKTINMHVREAEFSEVEKAFDEYFHHFNRKPVSNHGLMLVILRDFCIHWKNRPMVEAWSKSAANQFKGSKRRRKA
jgi:hypothetical protein